MSSTSLTLGNMVAGVLQWVILLILLRLYVYKPLLAAMQKRRDTIAKQINDANSLREEAEKLHQEQEALLKQAREDAKTLIAQARREGEEEARKIVEQAQREAQYRQKAALEEIQHERDEALKAIRAQVADLVLMATSKLLERNLDDKDQERYLDQILQDAGQLQ
ncbi:F0F1 ATP synthase subunit B [Sulfobacillus thermosulfidooxidans]|uniref:ATP synthase subunit b n=1 Tax=Sulfobacillus thermosulfidooxidans (strain DSM 9293 / VKM B-1269 / AT-1) TaxID=929705 RepID=A0A1W1WG27_SULTA|nr:F0F1 ATP synthase subunit B [Sulfobacillus thermosulfidooxidans]OLZ10663.1 ATP synthase F0 subunit B [Sulfobacillus thermosulfidooxidans]OLZ17554.1 ATP synthase F0 subunit B [Sulfobacillus thermosulfidooxidans]OLZ20882.1 ATP synthase F0 subunit B [Sulfobacillus thermosulfidooxidans]SMC05195.1 F-type H+-transporting ATPase subunit b [Sulfobacillus thermosulfidooxidans DSM 9293]